MGCLTSKVVEEEAAARAAPMRREQAGTAAYCDMVLGAGVAFAGCASASGRRDCKRCRLMPPQPRPEPRGQATDLADAFAAELPRRRASRAD